MKKGTLLMLTVAAMLLSSCVVSKKKYEIAEAGRLAALYSRDSLADLLSMTRTDYAILDELKNSLEADTALLKNSIRNYQQLLATGQDENQKLNANLAKKISELQDREKTIAELQKMIDQQKKKVKDLLNSVKDALLGFSSDELTVREEDGKVYVAMSDKLLFESGKAIVNQQGREALGKLAQVLNKQTDIDVYIEGHTDNVPIKTAVFQDNWDLSVIRATSVVRILTETYNVNPLQIQPCGRGEFKPVDVNTTSEGRARNRRTEIIMAPRLDKLFKMLEESGQ
ncbi:MAG: OmpA family protein [Bacteroidaceae bacterium]|nr:OmpA family protein [Bacteroidaceae bacterium]